MFTFSTHRASFNRRIIAVLFTLLIAFNTCAFASETIFYILRNQTPDRMTAPINTLNSLKKNYKKIDILIPQAYTIDAAGTVNREIEPVILDFAIAHSMKIMPLITNAGFSREIAHQFLFDTAAETKAINRLVQICKEHHFYGIQLDFEMIHKSDRDALTRFYELAAKVMHEAGFAVSFAIAPVVTDQPDSVFLQKIYDNWEGAFDLKKIGDTADFVTIMAYNQHGGPTTPGPTASLPWINQAILYALNTISPNKISLGIADFSTHWYTDSNRSQKVQMKMRALSYEDAIKIANNHRERVIWDNQFAISYVIYHKNWLNEYLFIEDAKSFSAKYDLIKKYKLRGVSIFDLGTEDPSIWKKLPDQKSLS